MVHFATDRFALSSRPSMPLSPRSRWLPLALAGALVASFAACGDPLRIRASLVTLEDTLVVNSVFDAAAPPTAAVVLDIADQPNVFAIASRRPVARRVGPEFYGVGAGFDVAIDVGGDSVRFVPPRLLASTLSNVRRVGLRRDTSAFESVTLAPNRGYVFDTVAVTARVGQTVYVVSQHPACAGEFNSELYAKVGVMALDAAARTATLRVRLNPNCGFRSFLPGVPSR